MREFIDSLKAANERIRPDEHLVESVLKAAEREPREASGEKASLRAADEMRPKPVSRRAFFAAAAASAFLIGLGTLRVVPARASTELACTRIALKSAFVDSMEIEPGRVVMGLNASFACVGAEGRSVRVSTLNPERISLANERGIEADELEFPAGSRARGELLISVSATDEELSLLLDCDPTTQYQKLFECLDAAEGALIGVEADGFAPATYAFGASGLESWRDARRMDAAGDPIYIELIKQK